MKENISVYIPAYNAEKTIIFSLNALLKQTFQPSEIIIINDCSTDKTKEILNNYGNNIIIIDNKINKGLGYCRNLGLKKSSNNLVASIDADVVPEEDWLEKLYASLYNYNAEYCGAKLLEKYVDNNIYNKWRSIYLFQNWRKKSKKNPPFIFGCNNLLKKNIWLKVGGYDENLKTNGEDINFSKKLEKSNLTTFYESEAICYHLQHDNITSLSKRYWRYKTYGYKLKKFSLLKFVKLSLKEIKALILRLTNNIKYKKYEFLLLEIKIFIRFIYYEFKATLK